MSLFQIVYLLLTIIGILFLWGILASTFAIRGLLRHIIRILMKEDLSV